MDHILDSIGMQIITYKYENFVTYYEEWKRTSTDHNPELVKNTLLAWVLSKVSKNKNKNNNNKKMALYLLADGASPQIALNNVAHRNDIDFIKVLLGKGADAKEALEFLKDNRAAGFFKKTGAGEEFLRRHMLDLPEEVSKHNRSCSIM